MKNEFVSVKRLAEELGMDRSHARRYVLRLGVSPKKRRTSDSQNQLTLTVTSSEAEFIKQQREEQGFCNSGVEVCNAVGFFYAIQLVPDLDGRRVKLGFSDDVKTRLLQHRTSAPTASLIKSWPCKRNWEATVIDALVHLCSGRLVLNEVYEFEDVSMLDREADNIFALLPNPKSDVMLSTSSPLCAAPGAADTMPARLDIEPEKIS